MKVLIVGSTGASGRAVIDALLRQGHQVTAFARNPLPLDRKDDRLRVVQGDVLNPADVTRAVSGQEAVVVTLGITENPLLVRLRGARQTTTTVRSEGTANVVSAMKKAGLKRLVVQSTYGVGASRGKLPFKWRMIFSLLLKPQIEDTERQEALVKGSNLRWSLVQPVGLTNSNLPETSLISTKGDLKKMSVSRRSVAELIADILESDSYTYSSVAISAA